MSKSRAFIVGIHPLNEALNSGKKIEKVLLRQGMEGPNFRELLERLRRERIEVQFVPIERLNRYTKTNHQGVLAFLPAIDYRPLAPLLKEAQEGEREPLIILLDGVTDVRNLGAVARSAEVAGATAIVVPAKGSAPINEEAIKSSAGALMRVPVSRVSNLREALYLLREANYRIYAANERSEKSIFQANFKEATAIVVGSEEKGVSRWALEFADEQVKIPMVGTIGSLNVSVAASIILFEAVRQRSL